MLENGNFDFIFCFNEVNMLKDIRGAPQWASGPTPSRRELRPGGNYGLRLIEPMARRELWKNGIPKANVIN